MLISLFPVAVSCLRNLSNEFSETKRSVWHWTVPERLLNFLKLLFPQSHWPYGDVSEEQHASHARDPLKLWPLRFVSGFLKTTKTRKILPQQIHCSLGFGTALTQSFRSRKPALIGFYWWILCKLKASCSFSSPANARWRRPVAAERWWSCLVFHDTNMGTPGVARKIEPQA